MIEKNDMEEIKRTILTLKRQNRRLNFGFYILFGLMITTVSAIVLTEKTNAGSDISPGSVLRVRGLIVVDQNNKERVRIGAPLPDPLLQGKRLKRNGSISGILLMDGEGTERSGYFTSDEPGTVALTLDTTAGQTAMFLANDETGANLQLHDFDNKHSIELVAVDDSPNINVVRGGKNIFQLPEAKAEEKK